MYVLLSNVKYPIVNTRINQFHYFKLNGGLSRLHPVDEDAVSWLTSYWFMTRIRGEEDYFTPSLSLMSRLTSYIQVYNTCLRCTLQTECTDDRSLPLYGIAMHSFSA